MIRREKWKYALYLDGSQELYDMCEDPGEWHNLAAEPSMKDIVAVLHRDILNFWDPDRHLERLSSTPKTGREKHFYKFSNQFVLGNGIVSNARP